MALAMASRLIHLYDNYPFVDYGKFTGNPSLYLDGLQRQRLDLYSTIPPLASNGGPTLELLEGSQPLYTDEAHRVAAAIAFPIENDPAPESGHSTTTCSYYSVSGGVVPPAGLQQQPFSQLLVTPSPHKDYRVPFVPLAEFQSPQIDATHLAAATAIPSTVTGDLQNVIESRSGVVEGLRPLGGLVGLPNNRPAELAPTTSAHHGVAVDKAEMRLNHLRCPNNCSGVYKGLHRCLLDGRSLRIWCRGNKECSRVFGNKTDFNRHCESVHPNPKIGTKILLDCPVEGCLRIGKNGFSRGDNLLQHKRNKHGHKITKVWVRRCGTDAVRSTRQNAKKQ